MEKDVKAPLSTKELNARIKRKQKRVDEWYDVRSLVGNDWAMFYIIIGAREARQELHSNGFLCKAI